MTLLYVIAPNPDNIFSNMCNRTQIRFAPQRDNRKHSIGWLQEISSAPHPDCLCFVGKRLRHFPRPWPVASAPLLLFIYSSVCGWYQGGTSTFQVLVEPYRHRTYQIQALQRLLILVVSMWPFLLLPYKIPFKQNWAQLNLPNDLPTHPLSDRRRLYGKRWARGIC